MLALAILLSPSPLPVPPTPYSLTAPILHYDCQLVDEEFRRLALRFRDEGGRGYWAANDQAARTPRRYVFEEDGTGLHLAEMREYQRPPARGGATFAGEGVAVFIEEVTPKMQGNAWGWLASLVITIDRGVRGLERIVGFCRVREEAQSPLSDAETAELLGRRSP